MWWIVLLAVIAWILIKFFSDWNKQGEHVKQEGGMRTKYKTLVDYVLSGRNDCHIVQETATFIRVGSSSAGGSTFFDISQTFGKVTIQWISKSVLLGNDKLEWEFGEYDDQKEMIKKINHDIEIHVKSKLSRFQ